jgi:ferritin-like metal-binding protein YciE
MAKQAKTLRDLFVDTLKDIYYAENKILKTLPMWIMSDRTISIRRR